MSMRIVFSRQHEQYDEGKDYYVERSLAIRLCDNTIAKPYIVYMAEKAKADEAEKAAKMKEVEITKREAEQKTLRESKTKYKTAYSKKSKIKEIAVIEKE